MEDPRSVTLTGNGFERIFVSYIGSAAALESAAALGETSGELASTLALPLRSEVFSCDAVSLAARLPCETVDLIVTSPPYWGLRTYGLQHDEAVLDRWLDEGNDPEHAPPYDWYRAAGGQLGLEPFPGWFVEHLVSIFEALRPSLKLDGNLWVNLGDTYFARWSSIREGRQGLGGRERVRRRTPAGGIRHDKQLLLVPSRFAIAMQEAGWILRNDVIWAKPSVAPRPERDRLRLSHEHFFHFVQRTPGGRPSYYYNLDHVEQGALDVVTTAARPSFDGHSAVFPPELVTPRILSSSRPGGIVVDPFCGTGVALAQAVAHDRIAIGADLNTQFAAVARTRLAALSSDEAA